jgi:beta-N-acetylhexosaminidase
MVGGDFSDLQAVSSAVQQGAGGLVLFGMPAAGDGPSIKSGLAALQSRAAVHLLVSTDEEGGDIARLANVVGAMPWPRNMANTMTPSQVQGLVAKNAAAMAALGVNMDLAPVLDTASANDVIDEENLRSFSENGSTAAAYGIAFITGLRSAGMIATAKHFPGLGHANGNTDLGSASDPPLTQLVGNDLVPFRAAIDNGVGAVMMSNVTEPTWGSAPASLNPGAYRYLRSLGFTGMVITDSLDAYAIRDAGYTAAEAVPKAIEAGADMAMVGTPSEFGPALGALESAVQDGQLSMTQVTASVERILKLKHI